jgi:hypothetical protein
MEGRVLLRAFVFGIQQCIEQEFIWAVRLGADLAPDADEDDTAVVVLLRREHGSTRLNLQSQHDAASPLRDAAGKVSTVLCISYTISLFVGGFGSNVKGFQLRGC